MAIYKLQLEEDELEKTDCKVIAIHASLEDYRLAYFLNKTLNIHLFKNNDDVKILDKKEDAFFGNFIFEEEEKQIFWNLIQNENEKQVASKEFNQAGLFANSDATFSKKVYLLPEYKKVNYILKIEGANEIYKTTDLITKINSIERISTVYEIDIENLKSKNNLIF